MYLELKGTHNIHPCFVPLYIKGSLVLFSHETCYFFTGLSCKGCFLCWPRERCHLIPFYIQFGSAHQKPAYDIRRTSLTIVGVWYHIVIFIRWWRIPVSNELPLFIALQSGIGLLFTKRISTPGLISIHMWIKRVQQYYFLSSHYFQVIATPDIAA